MFNTKEKSKQMFGWLSSIWTNADDDYCAKEKKGDITYLDSIWLWNLGTKDGELPFKNIPITIKDIFKVKKKYSLISKLKTTYRYCIEPLLRREIHWEVGGMGTTFYSFDWLTLKVKYFHSDWYFDTWQNKNWYERYIWEDNFRKVKSKFYCHDWGCDGHEMDEDKFWSKVENMEDLYDNES